MVKQDLRIRRTNKLLSDALLELMSEKPFEKISVMDICEKAMVHRATFYAHFEDKYDLLRYCMSVFDDSFDRADIREHSKDGYMQYYMDVASSVLTEMEKNQTLIKNLLKKNSEDSIITRFQSTAIMRIREKLEKCEEEGIKLPAPAELMAVFYGGACVSLAGWWIENGMPFSAEKFVEYLNELISL